MVKLFGYEFRKTQEEPVSFAARQDDDGAAIIAEGGVYGTYVDMDGSIRTEAELVTKYRDMAGHPEVETAIDHIVNEAIVQEPETKVVELVLDDLEQPDKVKKMLLEEFDIVLKLLEFNHLSYEVFQRWYVDGRLYYHAIVDEKDIRRGIIELRYIDPRKIRKIREVKRKRGPENTIFTQTNKEYYIYNENGWTKNTGNVSSLPNNNVAGLRISKDSIVHCTSGQTSVNGDLVQSYLHKAIKPLNQLRSMEDSLVIYRISRAPERRIFYIDTGNLPTMKAEQVMRDMMIRFKNKIVYDATTGEIRDDRKIMTMLEDFWLNRREGSRGTEITTLPGGQNLGNMEDVVYFQQNLYKALNVPVTRLDPERQFTLGRSNEISRDEVNFGKFIERLRTRFSQLFTKILERQLILKGIITPEDWIIFKDVLKYKFARDNYWSELKETEILRNRVALLGEVQPFVGSYYSHQWVKRNVLHQSDEEIKEMEEEIIAEFENPIYNQEQALEMPPQEGRL